jgi:translation initiation factor IF-1
MPPQKNSGAKASKRVSNVTRKNDNFIKSYIEDIEAEGGEENTFIARVIGKMGNGRMEVFYMDGKYPKIVQASIRGSFRGKSKKNVWIELGSIVMIVKSGLSGSAEFQIMGVLSQDDIDDVRKTVKLDPRILAIDNTDKTLLVSDRPPLEVGFEFDMGEEEIKLDDL